MSEVNYRAFTSPCGPSPTFSSVAQLAERLTVNQNVAGSSPARGAIT